MMKVNFLVSWILKILTKKKDEIAKLSWELLLINELWK